MSVCRCWGHRFDEDLSLASLRVLPAFSVVPRWREALAVGCPLESLSSTWLGAPPDGKEVGSERPLMDGRQNDTTNCIRTGLTVVRGGRQERKWWDATVQAIDRQKNQVGGWADGWEAYTSLHYLPPRQPPPLRAH